MTEKTIDEVMADLAAQGVTISVRLGAGAADVTRPAHVIRDAAQRAGIHEEKP